MISGVRRSFTPNTKNYREAFIMYNDWLRGNQSDILNLSNKDKTMLGTVNDYINKRKNDRLNRIKPTYLKQVKSILKRLAKSIGNEKLVNDVVQDDIYNFLNYDTDVTSTKTIQSYLVTIKQYFAWCFDNKRSTYDPAFNLKAANFTTSRTAQANRANQSNNLKYWTWEEVNLLRKHGLTYLKSNLNDGTIYYAAMFMAFTGLRNGECRALTYDKITINENGFYEILVNSQVIGSKRENYTKNNRDRTIPLPDEALNILAELKEFELNRLSLNRNVDIGSPQAIFINPTAQNKNKMKWINSNRFHNTLKMITQFVHAKEEAFPVLSSHALRHGYAMHYLELSGETDNAFQNLSALLGHESVEFTMNRYISTEKPTNVVEAHNNLNKFKLD